MADVDAVPPPLEVVPAAMESVSAEQEEPAAGEVDLKRKLEPGTEANGDGEDAKRRRVDGAGESLAHFTYLSPNLGLG
jgi:hypothetical protein